MSESELESVRTTLGAVLLGSAIGAILTGIVTMQFFLYYKLYRDDPRSIKLMVVTIWYTFKLLFSKHLISTRFLDICHTTMTVTSSWSYLIVHFGDGKVSDFIFWQVAMTFLLTGLVIFCAVSFFTLRIFILSKGNWFVTLPIEILATIRFAFNFMAAWKMIEINHFSKFSQELRWIITLGLSLGTAVDVLIAMSLCWYLNKGRTGFRNMKAVIESIIVYTIETSAITSLTMISSLIFWLIMPNNLIFLALHFAISKLYANVLFATLNARKVLRRRSEPIGDTSDLSMSWVRPRNWDRTEFSGNNNTSNQPSPV